jgi:hypothetical protein
VGLAPHSVEWVDHHATKVDGRDGNRLIRALLSFSAVPDQLAKEREWEKRPGSRAPWLGEQAKWGDYSG